MHTYKLGEHDVCLDTDSDTIYLANSVATRIWSLNKEAYSTDDIAEILSNEYDAPKERALADVNTLLSSQLSEHQVKFEKYSDYIPDTEYVPSKLFNTKSHALINLAGFTVSIFCETAGLAEKIQSVFPTFAAHSTNKEIEIFIFERDGKWPITSEGKTLDIGKTENDVVLKCCREIVGKVRELTPNWCTEVANLHLLRIS